MARRRRQVHRPCALPAPRPQDPAAPGAVGFAPSGGKIAHSAKAGLGKRGEELAARLLAGKGYTIVARNWRCPMGEIDVVAEQAGCLAFVEVRTRRGESLGSPEESIREKKRMRLIALAESFVQSEEWQGDWRIDVVAVEMDVRGHLMRIDHYENAVTG